MADTPGEVLKRYRLGPPLRTQDEVGEAIGASFSVISHYENGRTTPSRQRALKLDEYLGARGEILTAFGYSATPIPSPADERIDRLQEQVEELRRQVAELIAVVHELGADAKPSPRRARRGASGSA